MDIIYARNNIIIIKYYAMAYDNYVQEELQTSNSLCGYRRMWQIMKKKYGLKVTRYIHNNVIYR